MPMRKIILMFFFSLTFSMHSNSPSFTVVVCDVVWLLVTVDVGDVVCDDVADEVLVDDNDVVAVLETLVD